MMHAKQDKPQQAQAALKFFDWAYTNGDKMSEELDYVPAAAGRSRTWSASSWGKVADGAGKAVSYK